MTFSENFQSVLTAVTGNTIYTDIEKWYKDGIIDNKQFKELMLGFHQQVLTNALATAKDMVLSMQEVEVDEGGTTKTYTLQQVQILEALEKVKFAKQQILTEVEQTNLVKEQTNTEKERTELIKMQTKGFLDNRLIHLLDAQRGLVGEIEGGGLTNPQQNWDVLYEAIKGMITIVNKHPDLEDAQLQPPASTPTGA